MRMVWIINIIIKTQFKLFNSLLCNLMKIAGRLLRKFYSKETYISFDTINYIFMSSFLDLTSPYYIKFLLLQKRGSIKFFIERYCFFLYFNREEYNNISKLLYFFAFLKAKNKNKKYLTKIIRFICYQIWTLNICYSFVFITKTIYFTLKSMLNFISNMPWISIYFFQIIFMWKQLYSFFISKDIKNIN